ncbi:MAG: SurA N-terminal domain-containing protein [Alphaproteobacteria bacterium]|jgi:peptidyl-prolyl cis-trans isomerase D
MLNAMRQSAGSWVVKIFLGLLVLSFAAWGIGDIFRLRPDAAVVTVGDTKVNGNEFLNDFNRQVRRMQRSLGPAFDTQQARQLGMVDQVIQQSVTRALYDQEVLELELTMSDSDIVAWIKRSSAFKNSFGQFDRLRFEQVIAENGFSEQGYIAASRRDLSREQLFSSIMGGTRSPDAMVKAFYQYQEETRLFEVLSLPYDKVVGIQAPTDGDLNAYHEAHKKEFMAPEFRALSYLTLRPEHLLDEILATEREVAEAYEARMNEFTTPPSREVEQIVVAEEALALKIAGRLKDGGDFYVVAQELADMDKASVKLGRMLKGDLPEEAADHVFALASGQIGAPIETGLGWHIFRVLKVVEGGGKALAEVRQQLIRGVKMEKAAEAMFELANKVEDELAAGSSIKEIAQALNLNHGLIAAMDSRGRGRDGQPVAGVPEAPEFVSESFTTQLGDDGQLKEASDGSYFLLQVDKVYESALKPISQVRGDVRKAVLAERRAKAGAARAGKLAAEARTGKSLADLAKGGVTNFAALKPMTRQQAAREGKLGGELAKKLFGLRKGEIAEGPALGGVGHSVVRVVSITKADPKTGKASLKRLSDFIRSSMTEDVLAQYRNALRKKYHVEINDRIIDALFDELNVRGNL